ncbi:MAG: hypothetical protein MUF27_01770 [Acidobacteria bacterium]|jgi:hypothetical protein|nr:hypothetical protein [Acidobacteriota bacterium]
MTDAQLLLAVLVGLYLVECVSWLPRGVVIARPGPLGGTEFEGTAGAPAFGARAAAWTPPWRPDRGLFVTQPWPVCFSPQGVVPCAAAAFNPGPRAEGRARFVSWSDLAPVAAREGDLFAGGERLVRVGSHALAARLAALAGELRALAGQAPETEFRERVDRALDAALDDARARARALQFEEQTQSLRVLAIALFLFLFAVVPAVAWVRGLAASWAPLLLGLIALMGATAWELRRAHRVLFPGAASQRWRPVLTAALSPVSALRAIDVLAHDAFGDAHPAALAAALLPASRADEQLRAWLREACFPAEPALPADGDGAAAACVAWQRERERAALERRLAGEGPAKRPSREPGVVAWCPRCLADYTAAAVRCSDCGVEVVAAEG